MTASLLRVAVIGAPGRLGRFACDHLRAHPEFELVGEYGSGDDWSANVAGSGAEVALDATRAGLGAEHGQVLLAAGVRPLIATSGVTLSEGGALDRAARELELGGLIVPNLSLGIVLLERACLEFAAHLPEIEILEEHHERKLDVPSGTALELARKLSLQVAKGRGLEPTELPIESRREPGRYAHHEVRLRGAGELLTVRHDMLGPEAFGPGLVAALRHIRTAVGVERGLGHLLGRP